MLNEQQLKMLDEIDQTAGPKDLLHPIERDWAKYFRRRFHEEDRDPCEMSLKLLNWTYLKATDPNWKLPWEK